MTENTAFHIVTNKKFKLGQVIVLNEENKNNLYNHFITKNIKNTKDEDIINIINNNVTIDSLVLDKEDKNVLLKYCDITTKAIRETVVEMVRLQEYSQYPSRFSCIFATKEYSDIRKWIEIFFEYVRKRL